MWIAAGAVSGLLAVAAGAIGAHLLESRLSARGMEVFETAARYQVYHALAILLVVALRDRVGAGRVRLIAAAFLAGTVLFSGSLYALALSEAKWLGAITPFGGAAFLAGWGMLALPSGRTRGETAGGRGGAGSGAKSAGTA